MNDTAFQKAFAEQERKDRISYSTLASVLSIILMPAGNLMDRLLYPDDAGLFLAVRIASSVIMGLVWLWFHFTGKRYDRVFCVTWYVVPMFAIAWMIYQTGDPASPYYAGLNLVLLALGLLASWSYVQNLWSALLAIALYLVVWAVLGTKGAFGSIFSNLFFLVSTATIGVSASYVAYQQRRREFTLRYELNENRKALEETNEKLRELGQVKDRFFANISHELRTPLTLLISPLEILLFQNKFALSADQKSLLQTMHANGMRLLKMINDLLDLVRLESGRMEVKNEAMEINEFTRSLQRATSQLAQEKQLDLAMLIEGDMGSFMGDRDKLEKICLNLLFNAFKFTPAGGKITFRVARMEDKVVMSVQDTGIGIPEKQLPFVFDRFWQADNSSKRKYKGVGIGLSLVKELVEIQGGTVAVESVERKGTTFSIRLPYQEVEASRDLVVTESSVSAVSSSQSEEWLTNLYRRAELFPVMTHTDGTAKDTAQTGDVHRPKALVADDEPAMVKFISSQIREHYEVVEAVDGAEAVALAGQHLPDIILLDMNMPEMDGLEVCRKLRLDPATQKTPIILITARADEETKLASLAAGANDFLSKPFSVAELHVRIKNLVQSHTYQRELNTRNTTLSSTIEQLKETEIQLVQSAKMASLGRMSAGIIHEINNPLNFATTGLYALRNKAKLLPHEQQGEYAEILHDVEDGLKRVRNIVTDLRTFTHPDTELADEVDVADAVASVVRYLASEWRGKVDITVDIPEGQRVHANRNRLIQVLLNLVQNALDALAEKEFKEERASITISGLANSDASSILVRDNGPGIAPEILDKIFDPFFTTKDVGKGMGLGLSICYRIVKNYGGEIHVKSERGQFTEFALEFRREKSTLQAA